MSKMRFAAAMVSALALSTPASAGFFDFTLAPYVGASAGVAKTDECNFPYCDEWDTAWKIFGGFEVNQYISMEVGYADLGTVGYGGAGSRETNGMIMQVIGTYALNPSFTLIGRGGMNILNTEVNGVVAGTPNGNTGDTDVVWSLGLGGQYNLTKSVGLRMEWERYFEAGSSDFNGGTGEADIDLISAGVVYKF
jgi:OOP family OmpA-OmpF porin